MYRSIETQTKPRIASCFDQPMMPGLSSLFPFLNPPPWIMTIAGRLGRLSLGGGSNMCSFRSYFDEYVILSWLCNSLCLNFAGSPQMHVAVHLKAGLETLRHGNSTSSCEKQGHPLPLPKYRSWKLDEKSRASQQYCRAP